MDSERIRGGAVKTWKIGDVTISRVIEVASTGKMTWILPDATAESLLKVPWCQPDFVTEKGEATMNVQALLIESQGERIVVDTCVGNDKNLPEMKYWHNKTGGTFLKDLAAAGFAADRVDKVLCTHLHVDHVGWNTRKEDGRWVPTFENARHLWNRDEYDHWVREGQAEFGDVVGESVIPIFEADLVDFVEADSKVTDEVALEPTFGHTPGHVSVHIRSRGEEAVITGDLMHHPVQFARPEWRSSADWNPDQAEFTRRTFLERYADTPTLIIGTHFAGPSAGRVVRDGDVWRLDY